MVYSVELRADSDEHGLEVQSVGVRAFWCRFVYIIGQMGHFAMSREHFDPGFVVSGCVWVFHPLTCAMSAQV